MKSESQLTYFLADFEVNSFVGREARTANSTFAIGGVSCSADSLVVAESFVLRIKFSGKNPAHRKSANRYMPLIQLCVHSFL
ncbi:MAG: hypothetical protein WAT27_18310 [Chitinophagales bacterium]